MARVRRQPAATGRTPTRGAPASTRRSGPETRHQAEPGTLDAVFHGAPDALVLSTAEGVIVRANREAERLFGYAPQELEGQLVERLVAADLRGAHARHRLALETPEAPRRIGGDGQRLRAVRKDGSEFFVEISLGAIDVPGGVLYVSAIRDVSARCALEDQLLQAQRHEVLGQLASAIAHDFNNLVQVIATSAEYALDQLRPGNPAWREVEMIRGAGVRAASLIRRLLAFSGRTTQPGDLDLEATISTLEPLLQRLMGPTIHVEVRCDGPLDAVRADPTQIEQLILNLAANARDAMPNGGTLGIRLSMAGGSAQRQPHESDARTVEIRVHDTGVGMDADVLGHIFEPFFTTKDPGKGSGLGLSTVHGIVRQCGGDIACESRPGAGTTFTVRLPAIPREARPPMPTPPPDIDDAARGTETILVIDDEEFLRVTVSRILEQRGYRVLAAGSGDEALQLVDALEGPLDLVVTDILMPGMSGWEAVERIRERRHVRALFTSGCPEEMSPEVPLHLPHEPFIAKPFSGVSLARKIRETLEDPHQTASIR